MNDNQTPINDTLAWQIREFVRTHGVSAFLEYLARILSGM